MDDNSATLHLHRAVGFSPVHIITADTRFTDPDLFSLIPVIADGAPAKVDRHRQTDRSSGQA